jgi:hypothetical protein
MYSCLMSLSQLASIIYIIFAQVNVISAMTNTFSFLLLCFSIILEVITGWCVFVICICIKELDHLHSLAGAAVGIISLLNHAD